MNLVLRRTLARGPLRLGEGLVSTRYAARKFIPSNGFLTSSCAVSASHRFYSEGRVESQRLPPLMEFPPVMWPSFIKFLKNWIFSNFIIQPYFEQDFRLADFVEASKHAVQMVSGALQRGDYKSLEGVVVKEALTELKAAVSQLSVTQRQLLAIEKEDIFYAVPYQVGIMFDDADKRWVEITMCYHVMLGLKHMKENNDLPPISIGLKPEYEDKLFILNYRFIREFTKGVEDSWWLNIVNHFQPNQVSKK